MPKESCLSIDLRMYRMSGIGRYLQTIMPHLVPLVRARKIRILGTPEDFACESWSTDLRIELRAFRSKIFGAGEQIAGALGRYGEADLLWVPQYNVPVLYGGKLLVTIHDVCHLAHPETLRTDIQRRYSRFLFSAVARKAARVLCVSNFTASEVQKYLEVDPSRLTVTYPDVVTDWGRRVLSPSGGGEAPYLLAVGNVKKHKNLRSLVQAFNIIRERIPHNLVIVGKKDGFRNSDMDLSIAFGADNRIRFTGEVSDHELAGYYREAVALIFPSIYEGFGFPLVEAMANGCPVACSDISSLPEVADGSAMLFDPLDPQKIADAILRIATDSELRAKLIGRGLSRARIFSTHACAEKTAAVINGLLD